MKYVYNFIFLLIVGMGLQNTVLAEAVSREQIKGLDEQVQDIKKDVLAISAELSLLEEKLLFPSNTQVSLFVSVKAGTQYTPDAIQLKLDDKSISHHIYSYKEVQALHKGGVQRIYTGNIRAGKHKLDVYLIGQSQQGETEKKKASFTINKNTAAKLVEISLGASDAVIEVKER